MSVLTANTLFHFTNKDAMLGILRGGYRPSYSKEFGDQINNKIQEIWIPMLCFCDLPLSKLERHIKGATWEHNGSSQLIKGYGNFGFGMSKEWGIKTHLNPVQYLTPESYSRQFLGNSLQSLFQLCDEAKKIWENDKSVPQTIRNFFDPPEGHHQMAFGRPPMPESFRKLRQIETALTNTLGLVSYLKPYRDSMTGQLYYDEREWRFVIPYNRKNLGMVPPLRKENNKYYPLFEAKGVQAYDIEFFKDRIVNDYMISFSAKDIKYLIVERHNDIHDILEYLRTMPENYSKEAINDLSCKFLTCEQIHEDF